jgi:uncharacterized protein
MTKWLISVRIFSRLRQLHMDRFFTSLLLIAAFTAGCSSGSDRIIDDTAPPIEQLVWKQFTKSVFEDANAENKLVLLDIGANWCHWCHVMDDSTYSDPVVQDFLNANFILAREDQDSRADLFAKYRDYGWPAIIVFNAAGEELLKLKGYQHKLTFLADLKRVVEDPVPAEAAAAVAVAGGDAMDSTGTPELISRFVRRVDFTNGGMKSFKKSLNKPALDFALAFSDQDDSLKTWTALTIQRSYELLDPVWGGIYQYSTHNDWRTPHYEKILRVQAEYIRIYVQYGIQNNDQQAIQNAEKIYAYCNRFLSDSYPLFDNSQDADYKKGTESSAYYDLNEEERLKLGTPAVNHKQFLKENAMMAVALSELWIATADQKYLGRAQQILTNLLHNFECENRLYSREAEDKGIYSLDDNVAMLAALIRAHQLSGQLHYKGKANDLADALLAEFMTKYNRLVSNCGDVVVEPPVLAASNYQAAFVLHHLGTLLHKNSFTKVATDIVSASYRSGSDSSEYLIPYLVMSRKRMNEEAFHAVWISDELGTPTELEFVRIILKHSFENIIIDRVDLNQMTEEEEMLYGSATPNTLFMCTSSYCSSPMTSTEQLEDFFDSRKKQGPPVLTSGPSVL